VTAFIKHKNFDQAIEILKGKQKHYSFESAYILHRQGKNKEALELLNAHGNKDEIKVQHLLSQIQYKLTDYKTSLNIYSDLIKSAQEDEISDLIINILACCSNDPAIIPTADLVLNNAANTSFEKTYEYFFNLSQVQVKK
jgi:hypothetical protein